MSPAEVSSRRQTPLDELIFRSERRQGTITLPDRSDGVVHRVVGNACRVLEMTYSRGISIIDADEETNSVVDDNAWNKHRPVFQILLFLAT